MKNLRTLSLLSLLLAAPSVFAGKKIDVAIRTTLGTVSGITTAVARYIIYTDVVPTIIEQLKTTPFHNQYALTTIKLALHAGNLFGSELLREEIAKTLDREITNETEKNTCLINKSSRIVSGLISLTFLVK